MRWTEYRVPSTSQLTTLMVFRSIWPRMRECGTGTPARACTHVREDRPSREVRGHLLNARWGKSPGVGFRRVGGLAATVLDAFLCQLAVELPICLRTATARNFLVRERAKVRGVLFPAAVNARQETRSTASKLSSSLRSIKRCQDRAVAGRPFPRAVQRQLNEDASHFS